jgi:hypothetical protein
MRTIVLLASVVITIGSAALAEDAAAPAGSPVTASAARKAHQVTLSGGGREDIFQVDAGPNDTLTAIEIVVDSKAVVIPAATLSTGDKPRELKTSLTLKQLQP